METLAIIGGVVGALGYLEFRFRDIRSEIKDNRDTINGLDEKMNGVRTDLSSDIASVRTDLGSDIASVRTDLGSDIASVRTDLGSDIAGVRVASESAHSAILERLRCIESKLPS